jgi:hypothetical protein
VQVASQVSGEMDYDDLRAKLKAGDALYAIVTFVFSLLLGHSFFVLYFGLFYFIRRPRLCACCAFLCGTL